MKENINTNHLTKIFIMIDMKHDDNKQAMPLSIAQSPSVCLSEQIAYMRSFHVSFDHMVLLLIYFTCVCFLVTLWLKCLFLGYKDIKNPCPQIIPQMEHHKSIQVLLIQHCKIYFWTLAFLFFAACLIFPFQLFIAS